jgi:hypothetical protein
MDQTALYAMIKDSGFTVLVFEDHPQFFGNWRKKMKKMGTDLFSTRPGGRAYSVSASCVFASQ